MAGHIERAHHVTSVLDGETPIEAMRRFARQHPGCGCVPCVQRASVLQQHNAQAGAAAPKPATPRRGGTDALPEEV